MFAVMAVREVNIAAPATPFRRQMGEKSIRTLKSA